MFSDTLISWSAGVRCKDVATGCPPPDTRSRATVYRDQMGGREIVGQSTSKQHYFVLFSAAGAVLSTQSSIYCEPAIVSAPDSQDRRHLCRCLAPLSLTSAVSTYTYWLSRSKQKAIAIGLLPS